MFNIKEQLSKKFVTRHVYDNLPHSNWLSNSKKDGLWFETESAALAELNVIQQIFNDYNWGVQLTVESPSMFSTFINKVFN